MGINNCCEKRDEKISSSNPPTRRLQGVDQELDSVLDNFTEFIREKQKLEKEYTLRGATLSADAGGTGETTGNLAVTGISVKGLAKHINTLIKMENVGSFSERTYMVPSIFFTVPYEHNQAVIIFKALGNLINYTFKRQPSPKISQFFKVQRYRFPPRKQTQSSLSRAPDSPEPGFSYDKHKSNYYADTFNDHLRTMRAEGLEFIGGVSTLRSSGYEIESCFYAPAGKALPYHVQAVPGDIKMDQLQDLLNARLRQQSMLFRHCVTLYKDEGQVFECREMPVKNFDFHLIYFPEEYWCEAGHLDQSQLSTYLIKEEVINNSTLAGVVLNHHLTQSFLIFAI